MNRGEIWWAEIPHKRRPALILTRQAVVQRRSLVTVAPITTRIRGIESEVQLARSDGMPKDCVVLLDGVTTVPIAGLRSLITRLTNARMDDVCRALTFALGCS